MATGAATAPRAFGGRVLESSLQNLNASGADAGVFGILANIGAVMPAALAFFTSCAGDTQAELITAEFSQDHAWVLLANVVAPNC